jgi:hypothetical protein
LTDARATGAVGLVQTAARPQEVVMEQVCLVLPVQHGHSDDARDLMRELEASRKPDYAHSEERIGITKEVWFVAATNGEHVLIGHMETGDFANALGLFSASQDDFDLCFKRRMADCTGVDLNNPPAMTLPQMLSHYGAQEAYA